MPFQITVDKEKCKGCEECLEACTVQVFRMEDRKSFPVNVSLCVGCETCVQVCKEEAINILNLEKDLSETVRLLLRDIL